VGVAYELSCNDSTPVGLGVDLERCRPTSASWRLLRRLLTPREREHQLFIHKSRVPLQQSKDLNNIEEEGEEDDDEALLTIGILSICYYFH